MKDLDYTPDAALTQRIRESLPRRPSQWRDCDTLLDAAEIGRVMK